MSGSRDLLKHARLAERRQLLEEERLTKDKAEAEAVLQGVSETVALGDKRGEAFRVPPAEGGRAKPVRRLSGLELLKGKGGQLTKNQLLAGERYGAAWRAVEGPAGIKSCLHVSAGGGAGPAPPSMSQAEWRANQLSRLALMRARLVSPRLITVCDLICGQELTPRQAAANGRESAVLIELLKVALDLLAEET